MSVPFFVNQRKLTPRAPVNPLDKATVISILPKRIREVKHTIEPGVFILEPGSYEKPFFLVVGPSSWWREVDENQPLIEIPTSAILIAESVVNDYVNGIYKCDMGESVPGLFWIPGTITHETLMKNHKGLLDTAARKQKNWFSELVKAADILWARSQGNPLAIGEDMKLAAQQLGITGKEWLKNFEQVELVSCRACGQMNKSNIIVCPNCKVVLNQEEFKKLNLQFAS